MFQSNSFLEQAGPQAGPKNSIRPPGISGLMPICLLSLLHQLCNPGNPHIDMGYPIPCGKIHHAGLGKPENGLEFPHRIRCPWAVNPVRGHPWDGSINSCNHIQLFLHLADLVACAAKGQVIAGPGCRDTGYLLCRVDIDAVPIKIPQDFNWTVTLLPQGA